MRLAATGVLLLLAAGLAACLSPELADLEIPPDAKSVLLRRGSAVDVPTEIFALAAGGRFTISDEAEVSAQVAFLAYDLDELQLQPGLIPARSSDCEHPRWLPPPISVWQPNGRSPPIWVVQPIERFAPVVAPDIVAKDCPPEKACIASVSDAALLCAPCQHQAIAAAMPPRAPDLPADCVDFDRCLESSSGCAAHEARFVAADGACAPVASGAGACPLRPPPGLGPDVAYVIAGAPAGGDGSELRPFASLEAAVGHRRVALGAGGYALRDLADFDEITGLCSASTSVAVALADLNDGRARVLQNLSLVLLATGDTGLSMPGGQLTLQDVELSGTTEVGLDVQGARLRMAHCLVRGFGATTLNVSGSDAELEDVVFDDSPVRTIRAAASSSVTLDRCLISARDGGAITDARQVTAQIELNSGARLRFERLIIDHYQLQALFANDGVSIEGQDLIVRGPPHNEDHSGSAAMFLGNGITVDLRRVLIGNSDQNGINLSSYFRPSVIALRDLTTAFTKHRMDDDVGAVRLLGPMADVQIAGWQSVQDQVVLVARLDVRLSGLDWTVHHATQVTPRPLRFEQMTADVVRLAIDGATGAALSQRGGTLTLEDVTVRADSVQGIDLTAAADELVHFRAHRVDVSGPRTALVTNDGKLDLTDARFRGGIVGFSSSGAVLDILELHALRFSFSGPEAMVLGDPSSDFELVDGELAGATASQTLSCAGARGWRLDSVRAIEP